MAEFYYQIKAKDGTGWQWPPLFTGKIEATNKKAARALLEEEFGKELPQRVLNEKREFYDFMLSLDEIKENDHYTRNLFSLKDCQQCGQQYTVIEKYKFGNNGGGIEFCSTKCKEEYNKEIYMRRVDTYSTTGSKPVIYKITNKTSGKCYIGKTTQIFTLRWYQHFFQPSTTKFHHEIKNSSITDWNFEIIEEIDLPSDVKGIKAIEDFIVDKERYYMDLYNSIEEGYNSRK